ncbi:MAG: YCF48-related protein [Ignavibacteria bacterium]
MINRFLYAIFFLALCSTGLLSQTLQWRLLPASPGMTGSNRNEDISFINENTGWVVGYSGRVFRTTNGGLQFTQVYNFIEGNELRSTGFFDVNTGIIGTLFPDSTKILYRTTNGGMNWSAVNNISGRRPEGICGISVVTENIAYACGRYYGSGRIIKTSDQGISWKVVFNDSSLARTLIDCYFWSPDSGIAVGGYNTSMFTNGNAVVLRTTDGGLSWQRVHKTTRTGEWCWKISFISRSTGFISIEREAGFAYILKTTNNGLNWSDIPFREYDEEGIGFVNENTGWVGGWSGPTYQTTNGGANWQLAGWGTNMNRFRFLSDTLAYAVGDRVYKYSRGPVGINLVSNEIPNSIKLFQNYPNPFNPATRIKFDLSTDSDNGEQQVKLIVYDVTGKNVEELINEKLLPGSYEVNFIGNSYPSGIYFYKLIVNGYDSNEKNIFINTKRMILLK